MKQKRQKQHPEEQVQEQGTGNTENRRAEAEHVLIYRWWICYSHVPQMKIQLRPGILLRGRNKRIYKNDAD